LARAAEPVGSPLPLEPPSPDLTTFAELMDLYEIAGIGIAVGDQDGEI
jgi:hypothetical protein